jgi:hypothetical protein
MLALNRSLLNRECILMNVLKALASIISMCNLHVILLSKITPRYLTLFTNFKTHLNSTGLSVPHRKHITSPLLAQQVNAICRFVTMVY